MNYLDIIIAIPMIWFGWKGFGKGLIIELASLISLALGIYIAIRFAHYAAVKLKSAVNISDEYINLTAFILTFIAVVALVFLFAKVLEGALKMVSLSVMNKLVGMAFGMLKIALIISSFIYIINRFDKQQTFLTFEVRQKSLLFQPVEKLAPVVFPYLKIDTLIQEADSLTKIR
jgi:membrane protein required for colicin V production